MQGEEDQDSTFGTSCPSRAALGPSGVPRREICERTFRFAVEIVNVCRRIEQTDSTVRTLGRQLIRSGTSIGANVEEAQGGQSRADFISKYAIARKEARETRYWLRLITESRPVERDALAPLIQECNELIAIMIAIIKKAQSNKDRAE